MILVLLFNCPPIITVLSEVSDVSVIDVREEEILGSGRAPLQAQRCLKLGSFGHPVRFTK
jgi:hypothetical protein